MEDLGPRRRASDIICLFQPRNDRGNARYWGLGGGGSNKDFSESGFLAQMCPGHRGHNEGLQPPPRMVHPVWHLFTVEVLKWPSHHHHPVCQGVGAEKLSDGGGGD